MGRPRDPAKVRHATTFRFTAELLDRIDREAEARMLGRQKLVELLLTRSLDSLRPAREVFTEGDSIDNPLCPVCDDDGMGTCDPVPAKGRSAVPWHWTPEVPT